MKIYNEKWALTSFKIIIASMIHARTEKMYHKFGYIEKRAPLFHFLAI